MLDRKARINNFFNPFIYNALFYIITLSTFDNNPDVVIFSTLPLILYLIYYFIIKNLKLTRERYNEIKQFPYITCIMIVLIITAVNMINLKEVLSYYGGITSAMQNGGSVVYTQKIQEHASNFALISSKINYVLIPAAIYILIGHRKLKYIIIFCLLTQIIYFTLYGARIVFIVSVVSIFVFMIRNIKIGFRSLLLTSTIIIAAMISIVYIQAARSNGNFAEGASEVLKYYTKSLDNAEQVIGSGSTTQEFFWTLRPILSFPVIPSKIGIIGVYEEEYGPLQIKQRKDDFSYASGLGVNPKYNTFSSYGYAFLDAGWSGILVIFFTLIILQILYRYFEQNNLVALMLFPVLFVLSLDQLRTYWFFSEFFMYSILMTFLIYLLHKGGVK